MDDVEEYVDANENDSNLSKKFNFKTYFKEYWLAIMTALASILAIIQAAIFRLHLTPNEGVPLVMLPANFFLRHVRAFVVLFVIFASANKTSILFDTKRSTVKRKVLFHYFVYSALTLVLSLVASYLIIMRRDEMVNTNFFERFVDKDYRPLDNFVKFVRGLSVHDIPGNILTTRYENYNELGRDNVRPGLGDGYNAPGFVVFGMILTCSTYFLGKDGEILRNLIHLIHQSMLGVYWIFLCYSPIALYFGGIVQFDLIRNEKLYGFLCIRYLLLCACVALVTLVQIFLLLPLLHFIRTRKFGYDVIVRLFSLFPDAFVGGSSVRMVEKTKLYMKSKKFSAETVDTYLKYCTLVNGSGIVSGFVINAIFSIKLNDLDLDSAVVFKIILTSLLMSVPCPEFIQGYMFGIIYFLNTSMINPDFVLPILLLDWFVDRFRIVVNVVADALTVDYIESMNKSSVPGSQTA